MSAIITLFYINFVVLYNDTSKYHPTCRLPLCWALSENYKTFIPLSIYAYLIHTSSERVSFYFKIFFVSDGIKFSGVMSICFWQICKLNGEENRCSFEILTSQNSTILIPLFTSLRRSIYLYNLINIIGSLWLQ